MESGPASQMGTEQSHTGRIKKASDIDLFMGLDKASLLIIITHVFKHGKFFDKCQSRNTGGTISLFADNYFSEPFSGLSSALLYTSSRYMKHITSASCSMAPDSLRSDIMGRLSVRLSRPLLS